jgi:acetoacetyl-CoA synthetase
VDERTAELLWSPPRDAWSTTRLGRFAAAHAPGRVGDYAALWQWSVDDLPAFWQAVWQFFDVDASTPPSSVLPDPSMPAPHWFAGAELNYAAHMLRGNGMAATDVAVVAESQSRDTTTWTLAELREQVRRARAGLVRLGVGRGDRVAAYLPNIPETLVAFLATASLGAVWSSCAPEFGTRSVVDRWSQIEPTVLLTVDGYVYGDKRIDRAVEVAEIRAALPSIQHTVLLGYLDPDADVDDTRSWDALVADTDAPLEFTPVPFGHPLYVLYSSGTTGLPKPIVHGHGGILLEHAKALGLHLDLGPGDRFFWFSTTGWMMWNFLVSGLLVGSAVVLFDGNPGHPDLDTLWSMVERTGTTYMGVSAPFLMACRKAGLTPGDDHDLTALRGVGSTGAPLPPDGFRWVYDAVGSDLQLGSVSGGTDVCTAFVGSAPVLPVHAGVIPCRMLGCRVEAYTPEGTPVVGEQGELVITAPMPSMPIGFWGDDDGSRYHDAYFDHFPGVWRHGDWITIHEDGSCVITGRSDATLNRGGVRLGTAEFYAVVEGLDGIADSLVVHLEDDAGGMGELVLFVVPADAAARSAGRDVDADLRARIASALRSDLSPRHVPDTLVAMPAVPRTLSGKKLEVPVKRILRGVDADDAASAGALDDPTALDTYIAWARQHRAG